MCSRRKEKAEISASVERSAYLEGRLCPHCVFVLIPVLSSIAGVIITGCICLDPEADKVHMCTCVRVN